MGSLEIFEMNENGAGWVSLENASTSTKLDLELALLTKAEVKMLEVQFILNKNKL